MATSVNETHTERPTFTPARIYCLAFGIVLLGAGAFGFLVNSSFDQAEFAPFDFEGDEVNGDLLLGLEVNGWHNIVHAASGVVLLLGAATRTAARAVALGFGIVYAAVAALGFIDQRNLLDAIPVNTPDNILHAVIAVLGIVAALATRRRRHATR
jgi:hypothetical protein